MVSDDSQVFLILSDVRYRSTNTCKHLEEIYYKLNSNKLHYKQHYNLTQLHLIL